MQYPEFQYPNDDRSALVRFLREHPFPPRRLLRYYTTQLYRSIRQQLKKKEKK